MGSRWCAFVGASPVLLGLCRAPHSGQEVTSRRVKCVSDATHHLYEETVRNFQAWNRRNPGTMDLQTLDEAAERCFDFLFFDGCGPWEGHTLLHSLAFVSNVSFKLAALMELSERALQRMALHGASAVS